MKRILLFLLIFLPIFSLAQTKTVKEANVIADSILKEKVGDRLFAYFTNYSDELKCTYLNKKKEVISKTFFLNSKLPETVITLKFLYYFDYPEIDGISFPLNFELDKNFKLKKELSFDTIPTFLKENKTLNFISADSAAAIVKIYLNKENCETTKPRISYSATRKLFYYVIVRKLSKHKNIKKPYQGEM